MTAVVSRERAKATWLTAVAGLIILVAAFVMMACAAPSVARPRPHGTMAQAASVCYPVRDQQELVSNYVTLSCPGRG
jgi:hypothetical protein